MRTSVVLDDRLIEEAFALTGMKSPQELVQLALKELVKVRKKKDRRELAGQIRLREDYDHKALRATRHDAG